MITVNIGAHVDGQPYWTATDLADTLKRFVHVNQWYLKYSGTEPTLVAEIVRPLTPMDVELICANLRQDCIAQYDGEKGELLGPRAAEWGPFNKEFFLTL